MPSLLLTVDLVDYQGNQVDKIQDVLVVVVLRVELIDHRTTQVLLIRQGTGKVRPKHSCMPTSVMIFNYCCGLLASKLVNLDVNRCMVKKQYLFNNDINRSLLDLEIRFPNVRKSIFCQNR